MASGRGVASQRPDNLLALDGSGQFVIDNDEIRLHLLGYFQQCLPGVGAHSLHAALLGKTFQQMSDEVVGDSNNTFLRHRGQVFEAGWWAKNTPSF